MEELAGSKVVAVTDSRGGAYSADGIDPEAAFQYKKETGSVSGFTGAKAITNAEILELDVDVLIPAAIENVITEKNAGNIKAKIIAEAAMAQKNNVDNRTAAYMVSVQRVAEVMRLRGWV
jgi:glutamate dehydrogenase (NAD(P)+)